MPIATSDGQYYESQFDYVLAQYGIKLDPVDPSGRFDDSPTFNQQLRDQRKQGQEYSTDPGMVRPAPDVPVLTPELTPPSGDKTPIITPISDNIPRITVTPNLNPNKDIIELLRPEYTKDPQIKAVEPGQVGKVPGVQVDPTMAAVGAVADLVNPITGKLAIFAGVAARTINSKAFWKAYQMDKVGESAEKIWKETGFFRGADNQWRFEISDADVDIQQIPVSHGDFRYLDEVIKHPHLFKAYPELKNLKIIRDNKLEEQGIGGYADLNGDTIVLTPASLGSPSVFLHEIQHHVQKIEGFAQGGVSATKYKLRYDEDLMKLRPEYISLRSKWFSGERFSKEEENRLKYLDSLFELDAKRREAAKKETRKNYSRLAGEVEARNVQKRYDQSFTVDADTIDKMTEQELKSFFEKGLGAVLPTKTEDISRELQHVSRSPQTATPYGYGDPMKAPPRAMSAYDRITSAAIKIDDKVYIGATHIDAYEKAAKELGISVDVLLDKAHQSSKYGFDGFVTSSGKFLDRREAMKYAREIRQVGNKDEDLLETKHLKKKKKE